MEGFFFRWVSLLLRHQNNDDCSVKLTVTENLFSESLENNRENENAGE